MSEILEKYSIVFTYHEDKQGTIDVTSISPLLSAYLGAIGNPGSSAGIYNQVKYFIDNVTTHELNLPKITDIDTKLTKLEASLINGNIEKEVSNGIYSLPTVDFLEILHSWQQFIAMYKVRNVEVAEGQGIIDLISDGFATALVIEKAVAVNWPDCGGSVGEYYSVSRHNYERQKELTVDINNAMIGGSDSEVFAAVSNFLNLFARGSYKVVLHNINSQWTVMAYDNAITYSDEIEKENRITYSYYPYGETYFLFTRSYNSIDTNRVAQYVEMISKGARPRVIVYSCGNYYEDESSNFVVDGHHKALAYEKLGLDIPVVSIYKNSNRSGPNKNIIPHLMHFLRPCELTHILKEDRSIADINVYMHGEITFQLDKIFKEDHYIGITLAQLLYNAYNSPVEEHKTWVLQRLAVLGTNKNIGNKLSLYYRDQQIRYRWDSLFIESKEDFNMWKKIFLEDEKPPSNLQERQKEISNRYYPPYRPPQNNYVPPVPPHRKYTSDQSANPFSSWRTVAQISLAFMALLSIIRGCK